LAKVLIVFTVSYFRQPFPHPRLCLKKAEGPVKFVAMDSSNNSEIEYDLRIGKVKLEVVSNDCTENHEKRGCVRGLLL